MAYVDACETYADVIKKRDNTNAWRRAMFALRPEPGGRSDPTILGLIYWNGSTWIGPPELLEKLAYPRAYSVSPIYPDDEKAHRPAINDIIASVIGISGVRKSEFFSPRRYAPLAFARQVSMALSKYLTAQSLPAIGRKHGGRDHTTALHAYRKLEPLILAVAAQLPAGSSLEDWVRLTFKLSETTTFVNPYQKKH
jgi:hypothetical protein